MALTSLQGKWFILKWELKTVFQEKRNSKKILRQNCIKTSLLSFEHNQNAQNFAFTLNSPIRAKLWILTGDCEESCRLHSCCKSLCRMLSHNAVMQYSLEFCFSFDMGPQPLTPGWIFPPGLLKRSNLVQDPFVFWGTDTGRLCKEELVFSCN